MKLNIGCGAAKMAGFVNVDLYGDPDVRLDLESFPWPWPDNSVDEVVAIHVMEHLGRTPDGFVGVMKELWRVCRHGAIVHIAVPHPRHDNFISDPTHRTPITPLLLQLFSRRLNLEWRRVGAANSALALHHGVEGGRQLVEIGIGHLVPVDLSEENVFTQLQCASSTSKSLAFINLQ